MTASRAMLGRIELRRAQRYRISAPVEYEWADGPDSIRREQGTVGNISTTGIYVETGQQMPPVGARVQVEVHLPKYGEAGMGIWLHGEGSVVVICNVIGRFNTERRRGFAASLQFYPDPPEEAWKRIDH